jgi:hypothetical protein
VLSPDGNWVTFHKIKQPNNASLPHIEGADLPVTCDVFSGNSGAALTIITNCWAAGTTQALGKVNATITGESFAALSRAVITGETTAGGGGFVNVKVDPSGAVNTSGVITALPNEGQQTMANSISVAIASNQTAVPVSGTFYQATQPVSGPLTDTELRATPVPVSGTFYQATQPVSATDLDIRNLAKAQDEVYAVLKTDAGVAYDARQVTAQANSGVDIGDVTINNAAGAAAVNIQDGGNTITVDGTVSANATLAAETTKVIGTVNISAAQTIGTVTSLTQMNGQAIQMGTGARTAGTQRVTIATDDVVPASQSGTWTVQPGNTANTTPWLVSKRPAATGGLSKFHLVGAATTNLTNIKASAGQVYAITAFNVAATPIYLKFHNTSGSPTAGSGVTDTFLIPGNTAGAGMVINFDHGIAFSTGIAISTVTGIADADTTAIAASSLVLNIYYT